MVKFVGGRGKTAPYKSVVVRIPEPILNRVNTLIDAYKASLSNQETCNEFSNINDTDNSDTITVSKQELLELASKVIKSKQSGKKSVIKLVTGLLKDKITNEDLSNL